MKHKPHIAFLLLMPAALVLSACQDRPSVGSARPAQDAPAPTAEVAPAVQSGKAFKESLPEGVTLTFPYHARSVKDVTDRSGTPMRRFTLEFLGGTAKEAASNVTNDMTRAGFEAAKPRKRKGGGYRLSFSREGYGKVQVTVQKGNPAKYKNPNAAGVVQMAFPAQGAPAVE